jgi:hypothetical protein
MAQTILLKRSSVPGKIPQANDLQPGELALNTYDGKLFVLQDDGTPSVKEIGADQFPSQVGMEGMFLKTDGNQVYWSDAGGTSTRVSQPSHGFNVGQVVRFDGTQYVLASAASEATADVIGIVTEVTDADNCEITTSGIVEVPGASFTPGSAYFLSASVPGDIALTEPTLTGQISKPLFIALSATSGLFYNWRGVEITPEVEIDNLLPAQTGHAGHVLVSDGTSAGWVSVAAATATTTVNAANSFIVGQIVRATGNPASPYTLAQANNPTNAQVYGIISSASPTQYTVTTSGRVVGLISLTPGALYYLSDTTPGLLTTTEPTTTTSISKPLFIATTATEGVFYNQRGIVVGVATAVPAQLVPPMTGQAGKFLTTNGSTASWASIVAGVSSFNARTGAVTLTSADVTTALGFTPASSSSLSGYLPLTGGTLTGDITTYRSVAPATGVLYLGNSGNRYVSYDGTNYQMPGADLYVNGALVMTGTRTISTAAPSGTASAGSIWYQY